MFWQHYILKIDNYHALLAHWLFISSLLIKHILMPYSAWPYSTTTLLTINQQIIILLLIIIIKQLVGLLRQKLIVSS